MMIRIEHDPDPESPRRAFDNVGTFWTEHRRYCSPDPIPHQTITDSIKAMFGSWSKFDRGCVWLPVYLYDHSGVAYRTTPFSCPWDSGQVGIIFATNQKCREEWGAHYRRKARAYLAGEVEEYSTWANGEVYGYVVEDEAGTEIESCWGFYGHDAVEEAIAEWRA